MRYEYNYKVVFCDKNVIVSRHEKIWSAEKRLEKERKKGVNDGNLLVVFTSAVFHENINLWEDRF